MTGLAAQSCIHIFLLPPLLISTTVNERFFVSKAELISIQIFSLFTSCEANGEQSSSTYYSCMLRREIEEREWKEREVTLE